MPAASFQDSGRPAPGEGVNGVSISRQHERRQAASDGQKKRAQPRLERTTLRTSRLLDFCNRKELTAQTGHEPRDWPLVVLKELLDNALDACEEAETAPKITVTVNDQGITVADNGPGIPASTVESILDFSIRVSSREAYVAPDRGAQGNALKCVVAMPFVLDGSEGTVIVEACGIRHQIRMRVDPIRQEPVIDHQTGKGAKKGSKITVVWPANSACCGDDEDDEFLQDDDGSALVRIGRRKGRDIYQLAPASSCLLEASKARFLQIASDFTWLNPHLTLTVDWKGEKTVTKATDPAWKKWRPSYPTSAHWYREEHLSRLIAGYIAHDQDNGRMRTVREFVAEFNGLTATAKQKAVLEDVGLQREPLTALMNGVALDPEQVRRLLKAMQAHSRTVTHRRLGLIGKDHLEKRFEQHGCKMETFKYQKVLDETDGRPEVLEVAFGWCPKHGDERRLVTGVNWSAAIINPFRRLGKTGRSLDSLLERLDCGHDEEVVIFMHIAMPLAEFTDRGKSALVFAEGSR